MKTSIVLCSALLVLALTPAGAQPKPTPAAPSAPAAAAATPTVVKAASQEPAKVATAARKRSANSFADARACLDLTGNVAIIKCAEKFL